MRWFRWSALILGILPIFVAVGVLTAQGPGSSDKFKFRDVEYPNQEEFAVVKGRRCATSPPSAAQRASVMKGVANFRRDNPEFRFASVEIPVAFHVIHSGDKGKVAEARLDSQIVEMNRAFKDTGFSFKKHSVDYTDNIEWFKMDYHSGAERKAKEGLGKDSAKFFNVYTAELADSLLGWATFPDELEFSPKMDGVVILHTTVPGSGSEPPYDLGRTLVHEAGHWLGLYHTFQGGCADEDEVADTPPHKANYGTPPDDTDTCPGDGKNDPVHNYMNYPVDKHLTEFTPGQLERAKAQVALYRSEMLPADSLRRLKLPESKK